MPDRPMDYPAAVRTLTALNAADPATGPNEIEEALYWAGRIGRGFLGRHVITYDGTGFRIRRHTEPEGTPL